jgi:hypothetical protein
MKNILTIFILTVVFLVSGQVAVQAQIHVKMRVNTATNRDTLNANHFVQIRGEVTGTILPTVTWDQNSGIVLQNVGGDYWEANFQITPGSILRYKFWTGFTNTTGTFYNTGWEGPLNSPAGGGNRQFIAGTHDTVVTLQFYNGNDPAKNQYWRPYEIKQDSIAIYFRVNMAGITQSGVFDPAVNGPVAVRGNSPLSWDTSRVLLTRETGSVNSASFWSGVVYVPKAPLTNGQLQEFKFVIQDIDRWEEGISNRTFLYSNNMINVTGDTTIHWYYFQDLEPFSGTQVTATISWRLKLEAMEAMGFFDRGLGDKIIILGPLGWVPETDGIEMTFVPALQEWIGQQSFTKYPGEDLIYKYYISWDTTRVDPLSPNFIPGLMLTDGWEEPGFTGGADRHYTYTSQTQQTPEGDFGYPQQFFNSIPPEGVIATPITINFSINMTNAADPDSNAANTLFRPGIDTAYIQFDGSLLPLTQGLTVWGTDNRIMLDDSNGDLIYTGQMILDPVSCYQACYRIVYTSTTGEIWNGGGVQRGRRYYQFIHPTSTNPVVWPSTFDFPTMPWKASELIVETPPSLVTDVDDEYGIPVAFSVSQNYPNPFNPSTSIKYSIPSRSLVQIRIYDITGSLIKTLYNAEQTAGKYEVVWNGIDGAGNQVATGIYFMQFRAGNYSNVIKMMLLK